MAEELTADRIELARTEESGPQLHRLLWAAFAVLGGAWMLSVVAAPPRSFHHAQNLAVWTRASEALRVDAVESRMGARWLEGRTYAHHPPLIILETALSEAVFGVRLAVQRMPAWLGTVVAIVLMERVLRRQGVSPLARAAGCMVGFGTSMVLFYGFMLDTPVTSVPFALACLLAWQRERDGDAARWERPVTCCLAVLSGWQAALLAFVTLAPRAGRTLSATAGAVGGVVLIGLWLAWAGGVDDLLDVFGVRTGVGESPKPMTPWTAVGNQAGWLWDRVGVIALALGVAGMVVAFRSVQHRVLAGMLAVTVLGYPLATTHALGHHEFWMFWVCLPLAFGAAVLADHRAELGRVVSVGAVASLLLSVVAVA